MSDNIADTASDASSEILVVKLGGELIGSPRLPAIACDVRALVDAGRRVVMVHGGGPQVDELSARLGLSPRKVGGRRVTDEATLDVVKMVMARLNLDLCGALRAEGVRSVGLLGAVLAERRPPRLITGGGPEPVDLGWVGDVTGLDRALLDVLMADGSDGERCGRVPVLACLGAGAGGQTYNINADTVANRVAVELGARALVLITNTDGVRRDLRDPATRIARLTIAEGRRAIADGTVAGGMIPKLEESFTALEAGVRSILIVAGDLAAAVERPGSAGTLLTR